MNRGRRVSRPIGIVDCARGRLHCRIHGLYTRVRDNRSACAECISGRGILRCEVPGLQVTPAGYVLVARAACNPTFPEVNALATTACGCSRARLFGKLYEFKVSAIGCHPAVVAISVVEVDEVVDVSVVVVVVVVGVVIVLTL